MNAVRVGLLVLAVFAASLLAPAHSSAADAITFRAGAERLVLAKSDIDSASVVDQQGKPAIKIVLNSEAAKKFGELTARNIGRRIDIIIDKKVVSSPVVREAIRGGSLLLAGSFTDAEAKKIVAALQ